MAFVFIESRRKFEINFLKTCIFLTCAQRVLSCHLCKYHGGFEGQNKANLPGSGNLTIDHISLTGGFVYRRISGARTDVQPAPSLLHLIRLPRALQGLH